MVLVTAFRFMSKHIKLLVNVFALLYLQFALWWLDLKLQSGPDALKKDCVAGFHIISSLFNKLKKEVIF